MFFGFEKFANYKRLGSLRSTHILNAHESGEDSLFKELKSFFLAKGNQGADSLFILSTRFNFGVVVSVDGATHQLRPWTIASWRGFGKGLLAKPVPGAGIEPRNHLSRCQRIVGLEPSS